MTKHAANATGAAYREVPLLGGGGGAAGAEGAEGAEGRAPFAFPADEDAVVGAVRRSFEARATRYRYLPARQKTR